MIYQNLTLDEIEQMKFQAGNAATKWIDRLVSALNETNGVSFWNGEPHELEETE